MKPTTTMLRQGAFLLCLYSASAAQAQVNVQITEWMYTGPGGEFIEFTNLGESAVDFNGWVYDDNSRFNTVALGGFSLSELGVLLPGQSAVLTESNAIDFRSEWSLNAGISVLGGYTNNLGRGDESICSTLRVTWWTASPTVTRFSPARCARKSAAAPPVHWPTCCRKR